MCTWGFMSHIIHLWKKIYFKKDLFLAKEIKTQTVQEQVQKDWNIIISHWQTKPDPDGGLGSDAKPRRTHRSSTKELLEKKVFILHSFKIWALIQQRRPWPFHRLEQRYELSASLHYLLIWFPVTICMFEDKESAERRRRKLLWKLIITRSQNSV